MQKRAGFKPILRPSSGPEVGLVALTRFTCEYRYLNGKQRGGLRQYQAVHK